MTGGPAPGGPGIPPRWTRAAKDAVGTAYSRASPVWFTLSLGILNEIYWPTIDRPQVRDVQYLVTDGETFFLDERSLTVETETLSAHALGFRVTSADPAGRFRFVKEVIASPHQPCVLVHTRIEGDPAFLGGLRVYVLCAPHLAIGGAGDVGQTLDVAGHTRLVANQGDDWLALGATVPFSRRSCGYVGETDGWHDLSENLRMDYEFDRAGPGNIALTGELDLTAGREFTLGLAFGRGRHQATATLEQSLAFPFAPQKIRFLDQWEEAGRHAESLEAVAGDGGRLARMSHAVLHAHEDKTYPGALIASLSIPWGESKGDEDLGGYHLVWTRDMVHSATGLLALGELETPLRSLVYLSVSQLESGGFYQNFWIDGEAYWRGVQLDEAAFPILLAWRLHRLDALRDFDPWPLVSRAAGFLVRNGPVTPQERWEELAGFSPSTLAVCIAGLTCAAEFARERAEAVTAGFLQEYADFLERNVERWTVTSRGTLLPGVPRHYVRITPAPPGDPRPTEDPDRGAVTIPNRPPGARRDFPAVEILDAGFLELVRYGVRPAGDPLIEDSLRVVDAVLKVETPRGPCWRRYNHDGYGQRPDGGPFEGWGRGRPWPVLTGERGHYELAAGRDPRPYLRALERFAHAVGLLTEQVWDEPDRPESFLEFGGPTGAAMPLMWAHAEYVRLARSVRDGAVFDRVEAVAERYQRSRGARRAIEVWSPARWAPAVGRDETLRVLAPRPFRLRWTRDEWASSSEADSTASGVGVAWVDLLPGPEPRGPFRFTFRWLDDGTWEDRDYAVEVRG